jgi:hypothetical protein
MMDIDHVHGFEYGVDTDRQALVRARYPCDTCAPHGLSSIYYDRAAPVAAAGRS